MMDSSDSNQMKLTVVIPTWNEEPWLRRLLASLKDISEIHQVIVVDNQSSDQTVAQAVAYGARILEGGSPADSRNIGANAADDGIIIFADADIILHQEAVSRIGEQLTDPSASAVHFSLKPLTADPYINFCFAFINLYIRILAGLGIHQGIGSCIAVKRESFLRAGGFDPGLSAVEDADLLRRLKKWGDVHFDPSIRILVSGRRFRLENPVKFTLKSTIWALLRLLGLRLSLLPYLWRPYPQELIYEEEQYLQKMKVTPAYTTKSQTMSIGDDKAI